MKSGNEYPSVWEITVLGGSMKFTVKTLIEEQELLVSIPYYEGGIIVQGIKNGKSISGKGYAELTGYSD